MRLELLEQLIGSPFVTPRITLAMVADSLRKVIRDPLDAEEKVGRLYGRVFKKREEAYDSVRCSRCGLLTSLHDGVGTVHGRSCDGL